MTDPRNLKKKDVLLQSEGPLLSVYENPVGELYFSAYLSKSGGYVFFPVTDVQFRGYLNSELTIKDIYNSIDSLLIKRQFRKEVETFIKDGLEAEINFRNDLLKDLTDGMKNLKAIEKYLGLNQ